MSTNCPHCGMTIFADDLHRVSSTRSDGASVITCSMTDEDRSVIVISVNAASVKRHWTPIDVVAP